MNVYDRLRPYTELLTVDLGCYSTLINYEILSNDEKKKSEEVYSLHSTLIEHDVKNQ